MLNCVRASEIAGMRVLVVDDEDVVRSIVSRLLRRSGFQVITASSGQEGLDKLSCPFDLVLLDMMMPGMTGDTVLEGVRRAAPNVPVIIYSGHADTDICSDLVARGATAVLDKRTPFEVLLQTCVSVLSS